MQDLDTIVATSSPAGRSLRAIVRMSGPDAVRIASGIFSRKLDSLATYSSAEGFVRLPSEELRFPAIAYVMLAPRSYTREDIVELHVPGSPPLLEALTQSLIAAGARPATPGEFTRRAFLNGRIDLTQAEAVQAVIHSRSEAELRVSQAQLSGSLRRAADAIRGKLIALLARVEASIDFVDQDIVLIEDAEALSLIGELESDISSINRADVFAPPKDGVRTVICGIPNAGKSALLNALAGHARAIVTPVAGTTRDTVEHAMNIEGVMFRLVDTAGVRAASSAITSEATARAEHAVESAELVLCVIDAARQFARRANVLWERVAANAAPLVTVLNKCDLPEQIAETQIGRFAQRGPVVRVSALTGAGLDDLREELSRTVRSRAIDRSAHSFWLSARHHAALARALESLGAARRALDDRIGLEFAAADLHSALDSVGEIVGLTTADDILDVIFSQFCVGK